MQVTLGVAVVLRIFLDDVAQPRYGYDLMQRTGFASGKLYPILARLEASGWLEGEFEAGDPTVLGRPPRRWYRLTDDGVVSARHELARLHAQLSPSPAPLHPRTDPA